MDTHMESNDQSASRSRSEDQSESAFNELHELNVFFRRHMYQPPAVPAVVRVTARYPDNHNNVLPPDLIRKLDAMTPKDFKEYIFKELTMEERESLMVDEKQRRKTFLVNWPHNSATLKPARMAQCGFYSVDGYDRVQCVFCRGSLQRWQAGEDPMDEHARSFRFCRFIKNLPTSNIEFHDRLDTIDTADLRNLTVYEKAPQTPSGRAGTSDQISVHTLGISTYRAAKIEQAPEASRYATYSNFPPNVVDTKLLAAAGFYYTRFDDEVKCFYCDGSLRSWKQGDDPWIEHARWFPDCAYLIQQKKIEFVDEVHASTPEDKKANRKTAKEAEREKRAHKRKSEEQLMRETLDVLGYSKELISLAQKRNTPQVFASIQQWISAIIKIEEEIDAQKFKQVKQTDISPVAAEDGPINESQNMDVDPASSDTRIGLSSIRAQTVHDSDTMMCKRCEKSHATPNQATRIGLPCGHPIFCADCDQMEKHRVDTESEYKPKCPACGGVLTGSMRFFLC